jgi:cytochrome c-type biogenesis protein
MVGQYPSSIARRSSTYDKASICNITSPRRPSFGRRSRRNTRYFNPKYQRRKRPLTSDVAVPIAFGAGLASFLSPCVFPLIPSYITFITGMTLEDARRSRRIALVHALLFVLGFSLIFLALGASATLLGRLLVTYRVWISRVGGLLVLSFGLYLLGFFNLGAFSRERRIHITDKPLGYLGTLVVGVAFGAGWTPCIGPILGSILTYAATQADLSRGVALLGAYSLGLAIPFVLAAIALERFLGAFSRLRQHLVWVNRLSGAMLVVVALLMITNYLTVITGVLQGWTPTVLRNLL